MNLRTNKNYTVHIENPFDNIKIKIQPLKIEDLNDLISLAMRTGFWGVKPPKVGPPFKL